MGLRVGSLNGKAQSKSMAYLQKRRKRVRRSSSSSSIFLAVLFCLSSSPKGVEGRPSLETKNNGVVAVVGNKELSHINTSDKTYDNDESTVLPEGSWIQTAKDVKKTRRLTTEKATR